MDWDEFKRQNPHLKDFWPFQDILNNESHRGQVLTCSGFLEQQLRNILDAFMISECKSSDLLDGPNSPFGTFSARTSTCHALGLISDIEFHDLKLIRQIRNDFAHDFKVTFDTQSVVSRCATLKLRALDYEDPERGEIRLHPAAQFSTAAMSLIMRFTVRPHYVSQERRRVKDWPY